MSRSPRQRKDVQPTTTKSVEELVKLGYRRTSNAYCMVSRIDRPDWVRFLATELRCAPADFFVPGEGTPAGNWCDHYRRCYSRDTLIVTHEMIRQIPGSDFDPVGYVETGNETLKRNAVALNCGGMP